MSSHIKETYLRGIRMEEKQFDLLGNASIGRAVTATLRVSPNGDGSDGITWRTAFQELPDALDAASTDGGDCTLILVGATSTFYDINRAGDPTWTGNYEIVGTHRIWAPVMNTNPGATSVLNFTGRASIQDLAIFTAGTVNGISFSGNGWRVRKCGFNSTGLTGAATSVLLDGSAALTRGGIMEDVQMLGHVTHTTGLHIDHSSINEFYNIHMHDCLRGLHITGVDSDRNLFHHFGIGDCALGMDLDEGNEQHFVDINFHGNVRNVDDEVGDHTWANIKGALPIAILPDDLVGDVVVGGVGVNTYGLDTELIAAAAIDNPFRIVGVNFQPNALPAEWYMVRFSANAGAPYYDVAMFIGDRREGTAAPSGTEHIFNAGTRISCSAKSETGGNNVNVWLEVQEI